MLKWITVSAMAWALICPDQKSLMSAAHHMDQPDGAAMHMAKEGIPEEVWSAFAADNRQDILEHYGCKWTTLPFDLPAPRGPKEGT